MIVIMIVIMIIYLAVIIIVINVLRKRKAALRGGGFRAKHKDLEFMNRENIKNWWGRVTDWWGKVPVMSTAGFVLAVVSLIISIRTCSIQERLAHLAIDPNVMVYVKGEPPLSTVYVHNPGPIAVSTISIRRFVILVPFGDDAMVPIRTNDGAVSDTAPNVSLRGFTMKSPSVIADEKPIDEDPLGETWNFSASLGPKQSIKGEFNYRGSSSKGSEQIAVHVYNITYFRPSDMNEYTKRTLLFDDGNLVFNQAEFRKHALYSYVMNRILDDRFWPLNIIREEYTRKPFVPVTQGKP